MTWTLKRGEVSSFIYSGLYDYGSNSSSRRLIFAGMRFKLEVTLEDDVITVTTYKGVFDKFCGKVHMVKQQSGALQEFFGL